MRKKAQLTRNIKGQIWLSGQLVNTKGIRPSIVATNYPIALRNLILDKDKGGGIRPQQNLQYIELGENATFPKLLAELKEASSVGKFIRYIPIWLAISPGKDEQQEAQYLIYPGQWVRVLSAEETAEVMNSVSGATKGGPGRQIDTKSGGQGMAKYKYVVNTHNSTGSAPYDEGQKIIDPSTNKLVRAGDYYKGQTPPDNLSTFEIDGKKYLAPSGTQTLKVKTAELIMPRDQLGNIERALQILKDPNITPQERESAVQVIVGQKGMDVLYQYQLKGGDTVGGGTILRDVLKISQLLSGERKTLNPEAVSRLLSALGVNDPSKRKVVLKDGKDITIPLPNPVNPALPPMMMKVREYEYNGKKYYSQDLTSTTMSITEKTGGVPLAQTVSLALAINSYNKAKTPKEKDAALLGFIDSFPSMAEAMGIEGYSNKDLYDRLNQYNKDTTGKNLGMSVSPQAIRSMQSDPLIGQMIQKMGGNSETFSKMPIDKQYEVLLSLKDVATNISNPLQAMMQIKIALQDVPGAAEALPKLNSQPLDKISDAIISLSPGLSGKGYVSPTHIYTIVKSLGLDEETISKISPEKVARLIGIMGSISQAKANPNDPRLMQGAIAVAMDELPTIFSGVSNKDLTEGIFRIVGGRASPIVVIHTIVKNDAMRKVVEKITGEKILDDKGNFVGTKINADQAAGIAMIAKDVEDGKLLPLTAAAMMEEKGYLKTSKVGDSGIIELADSLNQLVDDSSKIDTKDLSIFLRAAGTDASKIGYINPDKLDSLSYVVEQFTTGDEFQKKSALMRFKTDILPSLGLDPNDTKAFNNAVDSLGLAAPSDINTPEIWDAIVANPKLKMLAEHLGLITPGGDPMASYTVTLNSDQKQKFTVNPAQARINPSPDGTIPIVVGVLPDGRVIVQYQNKEDGWTLSEQELTINEAQAIGAIVDDRVIAPESPKPPKKSGTLDQIKRMPREEIYALAAGIRQLADGKIDIFKFAALLNSLPTLRAVFGKELNYVNALKKVNDAMGVIQRGGIVNVDEFITFTDDMGLKLNQRETVMVKQAAGLAAAYTAYKKGDYTAVIANLVNAFPDTSYSGIAMSLAKNLGRLHKGNAIDIITVFEQDPILKEQLAKALQRLNILGPKDTSLVLKVGKNEIGASAALLAASTILDALNGKIDPLVAGKRLLEIPGLEKFLGNSGQLLNIATTLYDGAKSFGHAPINPADIDQAIRSLEKILGSKVGVEGFSGVGGLSYGQIVGIVNGLSLAFSGKWQAALQQVLYFIPLPGGISVGFVINILFMIFPGLAAVFGKGGKSDNPSQQCSHCGCKVKDPGGADNNRDYKPGGLLCKFCGTEVRSSKEPEAVPGSPPLSSGQCMGYPMERQDECGPKTRTGLSEDCTYSTGVWNAEKGISNNECWKQLQSMGAPEVNAQNVVELSLYCKDEFAFYGSLAGNYRGSDLGKTNEEKYNSDKGLKGLSPLEYSRKINPILAAEFEKLYNHGGLKPSQSTIENRTQYDDYATAVEMYADLIRNRTNFGVMTDVCKFINKSGSTSTSIIGTVPADVDPRCDDARKKLNLFWSKLSPQNAHQVFNMFGIPNDSKLRQAISLKQGELTGKK